jgi:hypothetical protein
VKAAALAANGSCRNANLHKQVELYVPFLFKSGYGMPETVASPRPFMLPAWRAAAVAYRAARRERRSHNDAHHTAEMAIRAHHPGMNQKEASDEAIRAVSYASTYHTAWFWNGVGGT